MSEFISHLSCEFKQLAFFFTSTYFIILQCTVVVFPFNSPDVPSIQQYSLNTLSKFTRLGETKYNFVVRIMGFLYRLVIYSPMICLYKRVPTKFYQPRLPIFVPQICTYIFNFTSIY